MNGVILCQWQTTIHLFFKTESNVLIQKQNNDFVSVYCELLLTHLRGAFSSKNHMPSRDRKFSHGHSHPIECLRAVKYIIIILEICYNSSVSKRVFQQRTT